MQQLVRKGYGLKVSLDTMQH